MVLVWTHFRIPFSPRITGPIRCLPFILSSFTLIPTHSHANAFGKCFNRSRSYSRSEMVLNYSTPNVTVSSIAGLWNATNAHGFYVGIFVGSFSGLVFAVCACFFIFCFRALSLSFLPLSPIAASFLHCLAAGLHDHNSRTADGSLACARAATFIRSHLLSAHGL
jgi:hypothetical protein